jgi:Protein of unknown function DUF262/Protein of unknown function (DUF1524)
MNNTNDTRAKSVSDVFKASPSSVFEFFAKAGQGLYVPAYQRPYSWDKANISRLVEDVSHGFKMLVSQPDTVTFLGTIIAIHDTQHKTVSPLVRGKVPSRVMTIIDGQQRLTTLLIIATVLHEKLRLATKKLKTTNDAENWLIQEIQRQLAELQTTFEADQGYGDGGFRFYPRMIRSFDDQWSTDKQALYKSPLAWYLHKYGEHLRASENPTKKFGMSVPNDITEQLKNVHEAFQERVKAAHKSLRALDDGTQHEDDGMEIPQWTDIVKNKPFQQALLNQTELPDVVCTLLLTEETDFHKALRALLFSRFLLTRVGLTVVEATNEDSAFDLFEALNTTGEPLTAYETFKPKVIQNTTLEQYLKSSSHKHLLDIDEYLSQFLKTDEKQEATRNLVVTFALAETGEKLSRHLSEQRRFLRDRYEVLGDSDERTNFVKHLASCSSFYRFAWPPISANKPTFGEFDSSISDTARICIDYLRQSNHTITIAPLTRFYAAALLTKESNDTQAQKQAVRELEEAIKAVAAFWTLWRGSRNGTDGVDSHYRSLMQLPPAGDDQSRAERFVALARRPLRSDKTAEPKSKALKAALRSILKEAGKIEGKDVWAQKANSQSAYKANAVTRFLLLTALHDSPADISKPGLNEKGTTGSVNLLTFESWRALSTLEHIAPQKTETTSDWPSELYTADQTAEVIDSLGNLTLLPHSINSSVSNRSWKSKRFLYQVLASPSEKGMKDLLDKAQEFGVSQPTQQLLESKSLYMAQIDALGKVNGDWTIEMITQRGQRLAELCWDKLYAWIDERD